MEERAKGGVGLINPESIYVDPVGSGHIRQLGIQEVVQKKKGAFEEVPVRNMVLAAGMRNNNEPSERLKGEGFRGEFYTIGDCNLPRTMKEAFEEAAMVARRV